MWGARCGWLLKVMRMMIVEFSIIKVGLRGALEVHTKVEVGGNER